jgi:hypothetical protein
VKNGDGLITAETGFPLRPGGAEPGSGECFQCGQVGHRRDMGQCRTTAINGGGQFPVSDVHVTSHMSCDTVAKH